MLPGRARRRWRPWTREIAKRAQESTDAQRQAGEVRAEVHEGRACTPGNEHGLVARAAARQDGADHRVSAALSFQSRRRPTARSRSMLGRGHHPTVTVARGVRALCTSLEDELGLRRSMGRKLRSRDPTLVQQGQQMARQKLPAPPEDPAATGPIARMATAPLRPRAADALVQDYEAQARALYQECPGFIGALLLFDGPRRNARSITVWENKKSMEDASDQKSYAATMKTLAGHFVDVPDIETWRVGASLFATPGPPSSACSQAPHEGDTDRDESS